MASPRRESNACGEFGVGGFPFGFDVTCNDALVTSGDVTVSVAGFKAAAEVYNPTHVLIFVQSPGGLRAMPSPAAAAGSTSPVFRRAGGSMAGA